MIVITYPFCQNGHIMTYEDLSIMYGKLIQRLNLCRAQIDSEGLTALGNELNKNLNIIELILDQANLRKCTGERPLFSGIVYCAVK